MLFRVMTLTIYVKVKVIGGWSVFVNNYRSFKISIVFPLEDAIRTAIYAGAPFGELRHVIPADERRSGYANRCINEWMHPLCTYEGERLILYSFSTHSLSLWRHILMTQSTCYLFLHKRIDTLLIRLANFIN